MYALSCQESGGRYDIVNSVSGAYGRYQIMPFNWPNWAGRYLDDRSAPQTPRNQERVARAKFSGLYQWLGDWRRVAYWWLTGSSNPDEAKWSATGTRYVRNIMYMYQNGPASICRPPVDLEGPPEDPPPDPEDPVEDEDTAQRITTGHLNVRTGPDWQHDRVAWLVAGTTVDVLTRTRDNKDRFWYEVRIPSGKVGWVAGWFTRKA